MTPLASRICMAGQVFGEVGQLPLLLLAMSTGVVLCSTE